MKLSYAKATELFDASEQLAEQLTTDAVMVPHSSDVRLSRETEELLRSLYNLTGEILAAAERKL